MTDNGAALEHFLNTPDSAWNIIDKLVGDKMNVVPQGEGSEKKAWAVPWGRVFGIHTDSLT
jgi:hypothetical protein